MFIPGSASHAARALPLRLGSGALSLRFRTVGDPLDDDPHGGEEIGHRPRGIGCVFFPRNVKEL